MNTMWIYTQHGIASIVQDFNDPDMFWIRTRNRSDMEAFIDLTRTVIDWTFDDVQHHPDRDYEWRSILSRKEFLSLLETVGTDIDYPNFKDQATKTTPHNMNVLYRVYDETLRASDTHFEDYNDDEPQGEWVALEEWLRRP